MQSGRLGPRSLLLIIHVHEKLNHVYILFHSFILYVHEGGGLVIEASIL